MNDIEVKNLRKTFGRGKRKVVAVDDVSFYVKKGEIFGFLGVNGAGKTTTINMLTGLLKQDSGEIRIFGKDPEKNWEEVKNKINVTTAYFPLTDVLTVRQNLIIYAKLYHVKNFRKKIDKLLTQFEMKQFENTKVVNLSSGEKTRTALCKGLLNDPKVLFLDECTVGLDPDIAEKTRKIIKEYQEKTGCTILFTSHYMFEVEQLCDRIAFMKKGKILHISTIDELKRQIKEHRIEITLKNRVNELKKFLEKEKLNILSVQGKKIVFEVSFENDEVYKILNKIFTKGFMLDDLYIKKPTLDDVFIKIAREGK